MKAAVVCANEDVQYLDYEEPTPGPGEVKVKVKCSGICGSDIPRVLHNGVHFYPIVLGHEFSGDVVEVGEGVTKVKVGDHVSGAPLKPCMKCDSTALCSCASVELANPVSMTALIIAVYIARNILLFLLNFIYPPNNFVA